ncbi:MAG: hypothetical protein HC875_40660, partial [Anaerolineales bacterium]|nr:hypothetical protein [Anaerolineales bacterium]
MASYIIIWANLVVTGLVLSCFSKLGDSVVYFRFSLLIAVILALLASKLKPDFADAKTNPSDQEPTRNPLMVTFLWISFGMTLLANILIAYNYHPNNWDSLTYHLPRVLFYISQGNLAHFETVNDRLTFFPLNATLFQIFLAIYGQPDYLFNFFNLASWLLAALAVYQLCRRSGLAHLPALLSSWIGVMATQVLAQGTATTNDLLTAVPLLIGTLFILE